MSLIETPIINFGRSYALTLLFLLKVHKWITYKPQIKTPFKKGFKSEAGANSDWRLPQYRRGIEGQSRIYTPCSFQLPKG